MNENMKTALSKNLRALKKPYFGRIDVVELAGGDMKGDDIPSKDSGKKYAGTGVGGDKAALLQGENDTAADDRELVPSRNRTEVFYLGKGGVMKDRTHILVVDWRAPIANVYYENGLGECSYLAPAGRKYTIDLRRKRTYEIEKERLIDYYDSEVVANDELLTKYLAKNKEAVLGEIIATIQKEQNDIIRKSPYRSMIVQGVAGSGKTTVAMHRISYILYNYTKDFKPEDFYIIGSNRILLNYITGVLPELDVYGVKQMTMEQLFVRLLYEDWDEKKFEIISLEESAGRIVKAGKAKDAKAAECMIRRKGTKEWLVELTAYCEALEDAMIPQEDIYLKDEILFSREQINRYRASNSILSIQTKIDGLNERTLVKLRNELTGHDLIYTPEERKALIKSFTRRFGSKKWKKPIFEIYDEFCLAQGMPYQRTAVKDLETAASCLFFEEKEGRNKSGEAKKAVGAGAAKISGQKNTKKGKREIIGYDVYDLASLAYIYKRCKETDRIREAHHIVVDEAQDFGLMAYGVLRYCIPACSFTIMGDVSQNIHFGFGLNDWEELKKLVLCDPKDTFAVLSKSYRNTVEISDFAQNILRHGSFAGYPIEPIIRHGRDVKVRECACHEQALCEAVNILSGWQQEGLDTIAVICRDEKGAAQVAAELSSRIKIEESDLNLAEFRQGIMVLPVSYTKGLEFDAVLLLEPTAAQYPQDDGHAKLLYVAATRALHELAVLHTGDVTALLSKKV
ncbi:MAG: AAA family ATPase [Lachnospiraceae bacterium]|nr:AAA family ATPase [Lachnospiraceae bacterium]